MPNDPIPEHLESLRFDGLAPGPRLLILGAVHGNETCGPQAIHAAVAAIRSGETLIERGSVTFVPVANPLAFNRNSREGDRNLNRDLHEKPLPRDFEDRIGNRLIPLIRAHDALLDIHSFKGEGPPFAFFGPEDNAGPLEPFAHAGAEAAFAACLGVGVLIHGWLGIHAQLIAARTRLGLPPLSPTEGFGTTEFMRFAGGYGATLECGRHDDPAAVGVASRAIRAVLAHMGIAPGPAPAAPAKRVIELTRPVICEAAGDRLDGDWRNADPVPPGAVVARRADGAPVAVAEGGFIVFPNPAAAPGEAICHLGRESPRRIGG
ncbi:MAG: succinylglutamate desuccinylase/aspartoacylase family protein [Gemmobacter sp.]